LQKKRSAARLQTDLSKAFGYWEKKYVFSLHFAERVFFDYSDAIFITKTFAM
jgi:hypothetical protein